MRSIRKTTGALAVLALGSFACGGDSTTNPPPPPAVTVAKASTANGDAQQGTVGAALANPLRVVVTQGGAPKAGVTVAWSATGTGALMTPASTTTDADGIATSSWTLPQAAGAASAHAAVSGATGSPVAFSATALAGAATQLALKGGNNQSGPVSAALANPLQVSVKDAFGNGVSGATVNWAVTAGGGSVTPASSTSDGSGTASTSLTLGPATGANTATAVSTALTGSPVTFTATGEQPVVTANVVVGNNTFTPSSLTVSAGTKVVWTWTNTGAIPHSVQSLGSPSFTSSSTMTGNGSTYSFIFNTPGTYQYDCAVHGSAMSGTVIVQ